MLDYKQEMRAASLTGKVNTYNINDNKDIHILSDLNIKINNKVLPNQKELNKEYFDYRRYWFEHKKQILKNYNSAKTRYRKDKLTKQQFVSLMIAEQNKRNEVKKLQIKR